MVEYSLLESMLASSVVEVDFFLPFLALMDLVVLGVKPVVLGRAPVEVPADDDADGVDDEGDGGGAIPLPEAADEPCPSVGLVLPSSRSLALGSSVESETFLPVFISSEIWADFAGKTDFIDFSSILG